MQTKSRKDSFKLGSILIFLFIATLTCTLPPCMHTLNENMQKYLTIFQTLTTAIIEAGIIFFLIGGESLNLSANLASAGIRGLMGLLIVLSIFVILSIVSGIYSWIDFRREEVDLLDHAVRPGLIQWQSHFD